MWEIIKKRFNSGLCKTCKNANALNPNRSTCANESFSLVVVSKAPKMHHHSKSESLDFRIASEVCQKDISQTYMIDVNTAVYLSTGKISRKLSSKQEKLKRKKSLFVQFKKRRLQLKENRRSSGSQQQLREGVTCESTVGFENISVNNTSTIAPSTSQPESDIINDIESCTVHFLDFEKRWI